MQPIKVKIWHNNLFIKLKIYYFIHIFVLQLLQKVENDKYQLLDSGYFWEQRRSIGLG